MQSRVIGPFLFFMVSALGFNSFKFLGNKQRKLLFMSTTTTNEVMKRFALEYVYVSGIVEKRAPYRAKHLELLEDLKKVSVHLSSSYYYSS